MLTCTNKQGIGHIQVLPTNCNKHDVCSMPIKPALAALQKILQASPHSSWPPLEQNASSSTFGHTTPTAKHASMPSQLILSTLVNASFGAALPVSTLATCHMHQSPTTWNCFCAAVHALLPTEALHPSSAMLSVDTAICPAARLPLLLL
jgi:hypothetical protein